MPDITIGEFANDVGVSVERIQEQLVEAGLPTKNAKDVITDVEKSELLSFLRKKHGKDSGDGPRKITLRRKTISELKVPVANQGRSKPRSKTVSIEFRKRRTYAKRSDLTQNLKNDEQLNIAAKQPDEVISEKEAVENETLVAEKNNIDNNSEHTEENLKEPALQDDVAKDEILAPQAIKTKDPVSEILPDIDMKKSTGNEEKNKGKDRTNNKRKELHVATTVTGRRRKKKRHTPIIQQQTNKQHGFEKPTAPIVREVEIPENISISELGQRMSVKGSEVVKILMGLGTMTTINQIVDQETAAIVVEEMGHKPKLQNENALEEKIILANQEGGEETSRAPVVTIMGHVDHGKTSLLDYIRETNIIAGESGGITQHIGAYKVEYNNQKITFLDTPGHEAFTAMRARGAQITDIVILVVAADDAVMPQTKEAISHTKAAGVPMVVAINKMDKPGADAEKVRRSLSEHEVLTESWGGKIQDIEISAKTGAGIDSLMESILLETDVLELKANKDCKARGTVIDSRLDKGLGPIGTVLIQKGTLKIGDPFICGDFSGKVRSISNEHGVRLKNAGPSDAIQIQGYDQVPQAADLFAVVDDEKELKRISSERQRIRREIAQKKMAFSLDHMSSLIKEGTVNTLPMVIKGDVDGSVEALAESLEKLNTSEVGIKVIHKAVGMVTESDVLLAEASKAVIIGFHVQVSSNARLQAQQAGVDIRTYNVIYQAVEELTLALEGMLEPDKVESSIGKAEVLTQFKIPKIGFIAGCKVVEGLIIRNGKARVSRDGEVIAEGLINSLKRHKDDSKEVKEGLECGIGVDGIKKFQEGDIIEVYEIREVKRKLELN